MYIETLADSAPMLPCAAMRAARRLPTVATFSGSTPTSAQAASAPVSLDWIPATTLAASAPAALKRITRSREALTALLVAGTSPARVSSISVDPSGFRSAWESRTNSSAVPMLLNARVSEESEARKIRVMLCVLSRRSGR